VLINKKSDPAHRIGLAAVVPCSVQGMVERINHILRSKVVTVTAQQPLQCRQAGRAGKFRLARCKVSSGACQRFWIARACPRQLCRFGVKPC
jgi:hypothetical protein